MQQIRQTAVSLGAIPALYFRRWTRSHAAIFRSLGRCVVIGHLAASVLEQLAGKSLNLLREWTALQQASADQPEEGQETETSLVSPGLALTLLSATPQPAPCPAEYLGSTDIPRYPLYLLPHQPLLGGRW